MNNTQIFKSALLLAAQESVATVDKQALRACGVRDFQVMSSGVEAALLLASGRGPEMVLCADKLADMPGDDFVRLVRLHPALVAYPVVVAVTSNAKDPQSLARSAGYSGLLVRPYTHGALENELRRALQCREATKQALAGRKSDDTSAFQAALAGFLKTADPETQAVDQLLRGGLLSLKQQRWAEAITELQNVLRRDSGNLEAMLGLAAAWRGRGNPEKGFVFVRNAVAVLAERRDWEKAQAVAARYLRDQPDAPNPLLEEVARLIPTGAVDELQPAIAAALALGPSAWPVDMLARACAANAAPEEACDLLVQLFTDMGAARLARELRTAFMLCGKSTAPGTASGGAVGNAGGNVVGNGAASSQGKTAPKIKAVKAPKAPKDPKVLGELREPTMSAFEKSFPALHEALMVARVTLSLFRRMK